MATRITRRGPERSMPSGNQAPRLGQIVRHLAQRILVDALARQVDARQAQPRRQRRGQQLLADAADLDGGARQADAVVARVAADVAQPRLVDQPRLDEHVLDGAAHGRSAAAAVDVLLDALGDCAVELDELEAHAELLFAGDGGRDLGAHLELLARRRASEKRRVTRVPTGCGMVFSR